MKTQTYFGSTTQRTVANQQTLMLGSYLTSKIKKTTTHEKKEQNVVMKEIYKFANENQSSLSPEDQVSSILSSSKKIQKVKKDDFLLRSIENIKTEESQPEPKLSLRSGKVFLEDGTKLTRNYEILHYKDTSKKNIKHFYSFPDRDLNIPVALSGKIVEHTCDNDCSTDEEQIRSSIKSMFKSLQESIKEENKLDCTSDEN